MSDLPADVQESFREYLGFGPDKDGPVRVHSSDADTIGVDTNNIIKNKIQDVNVPEPPGLDPAGRGRVVRLPAGRFTTQELLLQQGQSLQGVKGSTILKLNSTTSALTDRDGSGTGAYITIGADFRVLDGIAGQGVIEDLDIDAAHPNLPSGIQRIHGLYAPPRSGGSANLHTMRNVAVYNARDNGIHFDTDNDKLVCDRLRSEGAGGVGIYLAGGDVKARAIGSVATGEALVISSAAVELDQFDLWRVTNANLLTPTLDISGGPNGCVIKSGTVEGLTRFVGKNATGSAKYRNSKAQFAFVHFKHTVPGAGLNPPDCYLEVQDADLVELISCKWGVSGNTTPTPYNYLIKITNSGDTSYDGMVKIIGGSGMLRFLGRTGTGVNKMRIDALKHICNRPERLLFEWGRMGTVEMVPKTAVDGTDPTLFTHLRCDGTQYLRDDYPFAFLNVNAHYGYWNYYLNDGAHTTFTMPRLPVLSSDCVPAIRAVP